MNTQSKGQETERDSLNTPENLLHEDGTDGNDSDSDATPKGSMPTTAIAASDYKAISSAYAYAAANFAGMLAVNQPVSSTVTSNFPICRQQPQLTSTSLASNRTPQLLHAGTQNGYMVGADRSLFG